MRNVSVSSKVVYAVKAAWCVLLSVVLMVGLLPLPAFQAKAYAGDAPLTAGTSDAFEDASEDDGAGDALEW